jgi:peptidoglycan/LPS O-acetylase OafA/YrhL
MRISLVLPFLALAVLRLRSRWIALAAAVLSLSFFPLATLLSNTPLTSRTAAINTTLTLHYAAFFLIGSLVAKHLDRINRRYARLSTLQAGIIAVVSLALYAFANASSLTERFSIPPDLYDWGAAAGAAALIIFAINSRPFHTFLTTRPVHHLGRISYSLYLVHGTTLFVLIHTLLGRISISRLLLIYLFATLLIAEIFHRLIEHPAMLLGRRLTTPRQPLPQPDSTNSTDSPLIARPPA